ncbi:hypothetical protein [Nonomuraea sp. NPDC049695]|uniref:hypothetical protein n=1 Tax=Nonomuraea sp. NPDC049695 TaxID=3154734 RepID=UPI0034383906
MTKAAQALATWQALASQHAACLTVIYWADQNAEAAQRDAWHSGSRLEKADVWRWLPSRTLAGQLKAHGLGPGQASAALAALAEQCLIELRDNGSSRGREIKLTAHGRKVARAGGIDPAHHPSSKGLLSEGLWKMLACVWQDHPDGYPASDSGAWDRLLHHEPDPYVRHGQSVTRHGRYVPTMHLTDAGIDHYRARWHDYARVYPAVNAPHPDAATLLWPPHIDHALARLRTQSATLRDLIIQMPEQISALTRPDVAAPPRPVNLLPLPSTVSVPADLTPTLDRLHRATQHTQSALDRATARYTSAVREALTGYATVLADHAAAVHVPYLQACQHYAHVAAAVLAAVLADHDPGDALNTPPPPALPGSWTPPAPPHTGLPDLDAQLQTAHKTAGPPQRRNAAAPPDLLATAARLTGYADTITDLLADGHLQRILLRRTLL